MDLQFYSMLYHRDNVQHSEKCTVLWIYSSSLCYITGTLFSTVVGVMHKQFYSILYHRDIVQHCDRCYASTVLFYAISQEYCSALWQVLCINSSSLCYITGILFSIVTGVMHKQFYSMLYHRNTVQHCDRCYALIVQLCAISQRYCSV